MDRLRELGERIAAREARIGVIGLGYVGLPLALEFAKAGFRGDAASTSTAPRSRRSTKGGSYIEDVPSAEVGEAVRAGQLRATADFGELARCDVINVCVPTPLTQDQGPRRLATCVARWRRSASGCAAASSSSSAARPIPGTTHELFVPMLEEHGPARRPRLRARVRARAHRPRQPAVRGARGAEGGRRRDAAVLRARVQVFETIFDHGRAGLVDAERRDGEAAREHLPRDQHRPRERGGADVRPPRPRRLGGDRRRRDQALRLHEVPARARASAATASRSTRPTSRGR